MRMNLSSRVIFTAIGVSLPLAAHRADMNETHIYNPDWPPHAKFHDGQTLSMSILLGGLTTFLAWKSSKNVPMMVAGAACAASLYFITQSTAILYPGTAYSDPRVRSKVEPKPVRGIPPANKIELAYLSAVVLASWLDLRRCKREAGQQVADKSKRKLTHLSTRPGTNKVDL
jgi:hypothetical protein